MVDIRRIQRTYRLREKQINAMTSYGHLGVIGMVRNENRCVRRLRPAWHTRSDDLITSFLKKYSPNLTACPTFDYFLDRRMNQSHLDIFQLEKLISKPAVIPSSNHLNSLEHNHQKKLRHRVRDLEHASEVYH